jgi:O-antigen ligase
MGFVFFLLVTATLFLRPSEIVPDLQGFRIYEVLMIGSLILLRKEIFEALRPSAIRAQPITLCVVLMAAAIAVSHLQHVYLYGAKWGLEIYYKTALYYLMLVGCVTTPSRLLALLFTVCLCGTAMVGLCVIDYFGIVDFEFVTHITDREGSVSETNEEVMVWRMRGTGIFEDPNDICLVITSCTVLCAYFALNHCPGWWKVLWLAPLGVLMTGMLCTHSRGGLLSLVAAMLVLMTFRYGSRIAIAAVLVGVPGMLVMGTRQTSIDLEEGTAQDRIQLWSDGLDALKSADFFFGIGMGEYGDMAGLVAHNSFVHAYTELGIVGGTLFFGMFYFAFLELYRFRYVSREVPARTLRRFHPFLFAMLTGWTMGLMSLSRCYVVPTYLVIGLVAAFQNQAGAVLVPPRVFAFLDTRHIVRWAGASVCCLAGFFVFVKLFARWG